MQLTVWTYEGPPHVGAMRIATAMTGVHYVLHAPQGDTYADLLFTMIERRGKRPPVTYTTFQARDLGKDTAALFQAAARDAYDRFQPQAMLVGSSCTAELIQDDPHGLTSALKLPVPVVALELPSYQRKENWGAAETFYQLVRTLADPARTPADREGRRPLANILGPTALGFRHRDDVIEIGRLLATLGIDVNVTAPLGAGPDDLRRLGEADFNICLYPEIADTACRWLERTFGQKTVRTVPIGHGATRDFIAEMAALAGVDAAAALDTSHLPWWSRSVDSTYLTAKRVFIFGDATHAIAAARVARDELGFEVVGLGCYNREFARDLREAAKLYNVEPLITDDYLAVEDAIVALSPELVLGTQMERHIAKRLRIPCAVISAPVHVQDFPARYSPQMGFEGANVLFDTWVHPLVMGLEEHLLTMFRDDFEFSDGAGASHLGHAPAAAAVLQPEPATEVAITAEAGSWTPEAERELLKIPFFVRGKARRNTERYAAERSIAPIGIDTLYDAKAHHAR
ncbi:ferredoxin:protochlorophyllide reductase (ATP-dependent) subunit B [Sphingomonas sp. 1P06PA]|uniref:ferredoxin:protochlorophyllide reductase (ATP-dependent) subunit B n=1 Tax=Sphingomonas sp. 1P06PA TaxID=554121 RepID=UPI0039A62A3B